jgi:nucleotide-binding universal stress UspA family protein
MSIFPTRILLATDGSEEAERAALRAVDLANATDSYVTRGARRSGAHFPEELSRDSRLLWQALRADRRGVQEAAPERVLACVMGTRGLGGVRRALMGSVSGSFVRHAHCPVLVVRPEKEQAA